MTGALDEAELCQKLGDYYALQARIVMGVVFRQYLDSMVLTPFEIVHHHKLLRAVLEQSTLVENALIRVSTVQARIPGQVAKTRKAALQNAINEMSSRAWSAFTAFGKAPKGRGVVDWLMEQLNTGGDAAGPTGQRDFDIGVALALDLSEHRTWAAKVDRLADLLRTTAPESPLCAALDEAMGDALGSPAALQEVLDMAAPSPGELLVGQCKLVLGDTASVGMTGPKRDATVNGLFRRGRLPQAAKAVIDRVKRQLRSPLPFGRGTPAQDNELLREAMGYLLTPTGVVGGSSMAEAITLRYSRRLEQGGASAYRRSIIGVGEMQSDLFCRVNYLAAVSRTPAAEKHVGEIVDAIDAAMGNEILIESVVLQNPDMSVLRDAMDAMVQSITGTGLPEEKKARLKGRAVHAIDAYVQHGRLVQRLKQVEPNQRRQVIRMAELAVSGLVRENGGLPVLRQNIMDIVRQAEFQRDIKAQQSSEVAQYEVRRLYELLDQLMQGGQATVSAPQQPRPATRPALPAPVPAPVGAAASGGWSEPDGPPAAAGGGRALGGRARSYASAGNGGGEPARPPTPAPASGAYGIDATPVTRTRVGRVPPPGATRMGDAAPPSPVSSSPSTRMGGAADIRAAGGAPSVGGGAAATPPATAAAGLAGTHCPNCMAAKPEGAPCGECGFPTSYESRGGVHLFPGTKLLSRYGVGKLLGQGGFGATYLGWDDRLEVKVAVKEYYPANLISRVPGSSRVVPFSDVHAEGFNIGLKKFLEEARLLAKLREIKEIVGVQDYFEENDTAYLIMELLQGRTFKKYVSESGGTIDVRRCVSILQPIMKALYSVHEMGLIHRDIAPDNIFITATGERKLLDFGAARHAAGQAANLTVILKPGYAPPEQYSHEGLQGPWTDVYAMCATIFVAICGKTPPDATTRFMNDKIPRLSDYGVQAPPAFEKALMAGLAMRHNERPQNMRELQKALTGALSG